MIIDLKKRLGLVLSLAFLMVFMTSCEKEDNGGDDNGDEITSISISSSAGSEFLVNTESTFVVKNNKDEDITSESEIYVGETKISDAQYTFDQKGTYEVYAKYKELTSNKLSITVNEQPDTTSKTEFTSKVLVHDFTGTWCGHCAGALLELYEKAEKFNETMIPIEIHSGGSGSALEGTGLFDFPNSSVFNVEAYPTVWHNFDKNFEYFAEADIADYVAKKTKTGLAVNYDMDGGKVIVRMKSDKPINGHKVAVYVLEGGLTANQTNYENDDPSSPAYQKGDVIENFEYNNVARVSLTESPLGDAITDASGNEHEIKFSLDEVSDRVKSMANTKVVAFLIDDNNKYINAQSALANEDKDFD